MTRAPAARGLLGLLLGVALTVAPVAHARPVPQPTSPPPPPTTTTTTPTTSRPPASTSTAPMIAKTLGITAGIGAAVGLLAYAGKQLIGGSSPFTGQGAVLSALGGAAGAALLGTVAFFGGFMAANIANGWTREGVLTVAAIGAFVGAVAGGLLGGHLGDRWAGSGSGSGSGSGNPGGLTGGLGTP